MPHARVLEPHRFGIGEHACLGYADDDELCDLATIFVADGLADGQRVVCVVNGHMEQLREALGDLGPDRLAAEGALELLVVDDVYGDGPLDAEAQMRTFSEAVARAQADGFTGLRVLADNTPLLFDRPDGSRAYLRWESVCEPFIASRQLIGLCCFDTRRLPHELADDLSCVHQTTLGGMRRGSFRLIRVPDRLTLRGDVDWYDAERLGRLLDSSVAADEDVLLDLGELEFLDHHGLLEILSVRDRLQERGRTLEVTGVPSVTRRLVERLGVTL
jgi:anti-anti-sigma regulatory factor